MQTAAQIGNLRYWHLAERCVWRQDTEILRSQKALPQDDKQERLAGSCRAILQIAAQTDSLRYCLWMNDRHYLSGDFPRSRLLEVLHGASNTLFDGKDDEQYI